MKKLTTTFLTLLLFNLLGFSQESHLSLIYDFKGNDFDNSVSGMVGTNDSLYIVSSTVDGRGVFFRIDQNGEGYKVIWEFDNVNYAPNSLIANDTIIYGTTRFSAGGGGGVFQYSLLDYSFKFIKNFNIDEAQETRIKYITDSVLWLSSQSSSVDNGSIFSLQNNGTGMKKLFKDFSAENGQNPTDFIFHKDSVYIACYAGGPTYPDGVGSYVYSGCIIRIKSDGTGYENIIKGGDDKGTQPQSLVAKDDVLYGLFAYSGSNSAVGGQFFKSNLNGTSYDSIGALSCRSLTKMLPTDTLIYGISCSQVFGINPYTHEIRIFDDTQSNPDFGYDLTSDPAELNGSVYIATQQGGPNGGGTILKWNNKAPLLNTSQLKKGLNSSSLTLKNLFVDPEGDSLTYTFDFDKTKVAVTELNGILTMTPLEEYDNTEVKIKASDGWLGYKTYSLKLSTTGIISLKDEDFVVYPNPTNSTLYLSVNAVDVVDIFTLEGVLIKSYYNPENSIDVNDLEKGLYLVRFKKDGQYFYQKLVKN